MRYVRILLVALLAVVLVGVALANGQLVTVSLFPGRLDRYIGGNWQAEMPLFLVILLSLLVGMILGLIWEWMRESALRQQSARRAGGAAGGPCPPPPAAAPRCRSSPSP